MAETCLQGKVTVHMAEQYMRTTENNDENEKHYTMTNTSICRAAE